MNKPVIALVVATLACGSASAYLWQELRSERAQAQRLQARIAELERAQAASEQRAPIAPAPQPETPAEVSPPKPNEPTPPATLATLSVAGANVRNAQMEPEMRRRFQAGLEQQRALMKDPEYRELMRTQQKMGMHRMYSDLEVMLGLSKEEADRVLDVLAEQQLRSMELPAMMAPMDGSAPDESMLREQRRAAEELRRRNDTEMAAVLGPKYGEWQSYQQNMWSRGQVMRLRESLASTVEPLRQDQIKPLVQALAREQQQMQMNTVRAQYSNGSTGPEAQLRLQEEWLERTAQSHERIRAAVSGVLSPAQLAQLQEQQDQERKMQELNLRMQRARAADAQARGEYPTGVEVQMGVTPGALIVR